MFTSLRTAVLSVASLVLLGCSGNFYEAKFFCYPPSAKAHLGDYQYKGVIVVEAVSGPYRLVNGKRWQISFYDKQGKCLLSEEGKIEMGLPEFETDWSVRNSPTVAILDEKGNVRLKKTFDISSVLPK